MDRFRNLFGKSEPENPVRSFRTTEPYEYELETHRVDGSVFAAPDEFLKSVWPESAVPRENWRGLTDQDWDKLVSRRKGLADDLTAFSRFQNAWLIAKEGENHDNFLDFLAEDSHTCLLELQDGYVLVKMTLLSLH